ncbi:MAG: hypothetical protein ACQETL_19745 [Bacteroidota bacterium]
MKFNLFINCVLFFLILSSAQVQSQDVIYTEDQKEIEAKVNEITPELIKYKNYDQRNGPIRSIQKSKVYMIIYEDGKREIFKDSEKSEEDISPHEEQEEENKKELVKQKSEKEENTTSFLLGGKAGYFIPYNEVIQDVYGNGYIWGAYAGLWFNKWGTVVDFRSYSKDGEPYELGDVEESTSHINMSTLTFSGLYEFYSSNNFKTYGGVGLGMTWIDESLSGSGSGSEISGSATLKKFTFQSTGGMRFDPFYTEITFSSVPVENANFGGIIISGGLLF